jgi:hypothetical protein
MPAKIGVLSRLMLDTRVPLSLDPSVSVARGAVPVLLPVRFPGPLNAYLGLPRTGGCASRVCLAGVVRGVPLRLVSVLCAPTKPLAVASRCPIGGIVTSPDRMRVDPVELRQVGLDVQRISLQVAGALGGHEGDVNPPGAGQGWDAWRTAGSAKGWEAWPAMVELGRQWVTELRAVSNDVNALGAQLVSAADSYESTDRRAADAFRDTHGQ